MTVPESSRMAFADIICRRSNVVGSANNELASLISPKSTFDSVMRSLVEVGG